MTGALTYTCGMETQATSLRMPSFENGCAGKDRYPSEGSARSALQLLKRGEIRHRKSDGRWDKLDAYECPHCAEWHLGHP